VSRAELRDGDRGADDVDLGALDQAASRLAAAENAAVLDGLKGAIVGISQASPHKKARLGETVGAYPGSVAGAVERLLASGIAGPYAVALGPDPYRDVLAAVEGGYPVLEHLREILDGPVVWAPGVAGALVLSTRGGDFAFESGQDVSVGYESHDDETVRLYLQESLSFHVATPEAAVALKP
jgi:uncharacterized linocin/CFP29 family protein